ncbi:MAG: DNA polymerase III subunit chi [Burkholderiales bacterium]|nr:DNA polymerase III subunit chi [Burkholderiales bacterium]
MTEVAFHTGIANPLDYACRLLRKAYRSGARVAVHGEPALLDRLDQALWTFEPLEFVPHIVLPRDAGDVRRLAMTPIVLVKGAATVPAECRIGVSLAGHPVDDVAAYDRLIAIVGLDPEHREAGRQRWREYERAGHAVSHVAKPAGEPG